jgi:hypothetical protein
MSEIINLEEHKLSKLDNMELLVKAVEMASKQLLEHSNLIKDLTERIVELESTD